ncbi:secreted RxLR effector protein 161-like [Nicotiana tomentosiformis]|uniref:secreted RxLR effector protein 161-like n=1 Tax=Nicotiana tomentosiformis TaxID=4098 RepID=UPI001446567B|nr:secreted RxLR effector protein 161-like [Nicotiana tomentosiformis]
MKDIPYASLIGSLMYALVCTRPDIAFAVRMLGRYQSNPGLDYWKADKRVLRYLQGTKDFKLTYKYSDSLEVIGYSDSNLGGCKDTDKSTSGYIFLLAGGVVSWRSVEQTIVVTSTMEAEFIACYDTTSLALWLKNFIFGLRIVDCVSRPFRIFCDNSIAVFFSKNNKSGSRSKHIDIKYLMIRDYVKKQDVSFEHVSTTLMIVDPITKGLPANVFKDRVTHMGLSSSI